MKNKLIPKNRLSVDVIAPVLLGDRYNSMTDDQKAAYKKQYDSNPELFNNLYYQKKKQEYDNIFNSPEVRKFDDLTDQYTPNIELDNVELDTKFKINTPKLRVKASANNNKWKYQREKAAKLFNRSDLNTAIGVANFQANHGLDVDGMLGQNTLNKLNQLYGTNFSLQNISQNINQPKQKTLLEIVTEKYPDMGWDEMANDINPGSKYNTYVGKDGQLYGYDRKTGKKYKLKIVKKSSRTARSVGKIIDRIFKHTDGNYYFKHSDGKGVTKLEKITPYLYRFKNKDSKIITYNPVIQEITIM